MNSNRIRKMIFASVCLALCLLLPFLTGQNRQLGSMLCLMHIPVLLCGYMCGWGWGLAVGFTAPLLRSLIFAMPVMYPMALGMAFELAVYGFATGFFYKIFPKKLGYTYVSLVISMLLGRIVWGIARLAFVGFSFTKFPYFASVIEAITTAVPGIIIQLILIPILVFALKKAKVIKE